MIKGLFFLPIPTFSKAIFSMVSPNKWVWSKETLVIIESSGSTTFVESHLPPKPTSRIAISIFSSEKYLKDRRVEASK